jgi:hypothetical protein
MAMSKKQLKAWPWNGRPSARHVWRYAGINVDACERCRNPIPSRRRCERRDLLRANP